MDCAGPDSVACTAVEEDCASLSGGCTELCDGIDNDCDGLVDETFLDKGSDLSDSGFRFCFDVDPRL